MTPASVGGYAVAGLLVAVAVMATLPHRRMVVWGVTALLGATAGALGGVSGAALLDVQCGEFFCPTGWVPAIAFAAAFLALWRSVAPRRA
jgi:hypothetical protein